MENIFANRLMTARKMAGLSLQGLADLLGNVVSKQALNKYEQGKMKPDSQFILKIADVLKVSVDYFYSTPEVKVELANIDYRKYKSKLSKTEQIAIEEKAKDLLERYLELESILNLDESPEYFTYPNVIENIEDAEEAAKALRDQWKLGYDPIPDVIEMLEDKGYKVVELEASDKFDGMKAETDGRKVIVLKELNEDDDVVRKRFTALHELAHHALKFAKEVDDEKLCHAFACAVLYPDDMALKEMHQGRFHFYQNELILIKERWGISFPAIFNRALKLGIINDYVYKKLNIGYRSRNLHKKNSEPGRYRSKEQPARFQRLIYFALAKELLSVNEAAYYAGTTVWKFRETLQQII